MFTFYMEGYKEIKIVCDTFVASKEVTKNGDTIFAKNSDRQFTEAQYLEMLPALRYHQPQKLGLTYIEIDQVETTHAVLLSKPHWIWGAEMGANEHGLVIGNEAVFSKISTEPNDGIIGMDLLRLALERASSTDEAIEVITGLLSQYGQGGDCGYKKPITYDNSFLITDGKTTKVLETAGREWGVRETDSIDAISNSMTIKTEFVSSSATLEKTAVENGLWTKGKSLNFKEIFEDKSKKNTGDQRQCRMRNLIAKKSNIDLMTAFKITRDHGEQATAAKKAEQGICVHDQKKRLGKTTASLVSSLGGNKAGDRVVHWVTGTGAPCTSVYKPLLLELGYIPEHGPKPGADDEETDSLWWRHERLSALLLDTDQTQIDVAAFAKDRDALESELVALMDNCPSRVTDETAPQCQRIVEECWQRALGFENHWYERYAET